MQTVKLLSFLPKIWHSSLPQTCGEAPSATISLKGPSSFTTLTWETQVRFSELICVNLSTSMKFVTSHMYDMSNTWNRLARTVFTVT
jgi:hypothetical protein